MYRGSKHSPKIASLKYPTITAALSLLKFYSDRTCNAILDIDLYFLLKV